MLCIGDIELVLAEHVCWHVYGALRVVRNFTAADASAAASGAAAARSLLNAAAATESYTLSPHAPLPRPHGHACQRTAGRYPGR